jgi:hypothetical protein
MMNLRRSIPFGGLLTALVFAGATALAQEPGEQAETDHSSHHGQTDEQTGQEVTGGGSMMGGMMGQGMMAPGQTGQKTGQPMMGDCPMMGSMMGRGKQDMMGQGRMGPGEMQGGMAPGMRGLFGSRVTPMMNLSVEDVRSYLVVQLDRLKNRRLKVGDIKAEDGTITADVVTVDNSLVQRFTVDRRTGAIEYQD